MKKSALLSCAGLSAIVAVSSLGLLRGVFSGRMLSGHDAGLHMMYVSAFDEGVRSGSLFPIWSPWSRYGYGEPVLQFRPPLSFYFTEPFFLFTDNIFNAVNLGLTALILASALGMYFFLRDLMRLSQSPAEHKLWVPLLASAVYVTSPYFMTDLYVRGAYSELSSFAALPWLAAALLRLIHEPNRRYVAFSAAAFALLALSHSAVHLVATLLFAMCALLRWKEIRSKAALMASVLLGHAASAYYWMPALFEKSYVKSALRLVGFETYPKNFRRFAELVYTAWNPGVKWDISYSIGLFAWLGMGWWLWQWSLAGKRQPAPIRQAASLAFLVCAACLYLVHRCSAFWYEAIPPLQLIQFPWRALTVMTFAGAVLGVLALSTILRGAWLWGLVGLSVLAYGASRAHPAFYHSDSAVGYASREGILRNGLWFEINDTLPATVSTYPPDWYSHDADLVEGSGKLTCSRPAPTRMECDVEAAGPVVARFNAFDYPGWRAYIDGNSAARTTREPMFGRQLAWIEAGRHHVRWELGDTPLRSAAKILSLASWMLIAALLVPSAAARRLWPRALPSQNA